MNLAEANRIFAAELAGADRVDDATVKALVETVLYTLVDR
jgi:hypothetical protein